MKICKPKTAEQWQQYYHLRWQVLRAPWHQPEGSEKDALEDQSEHVMVVSDEGSVLGVGRVHFNSGGQAQIRYMAVTEEARRKGVGTRLLTELESIAQQHGERSIVLDAREKAVHFYEKHGYQVYADGYTLFGVIKHKKMSKIINANEPIIGTQSNNTYSNKR